MKKVVPSEWESEMSQRMFKGQINVEGGEHGLVTGGWEYLNGPH